jgi:hypothetical protein
MVIVSTLSPSLLARSRSLQFFLFPWMNQDLKGRRFANVTEVQRESLLTLDSICVEDFRQRFQQWPRRWDRCIQSQGEYFEGDQIFKLLRLF